MSFETAAPISERHAAALKAPVVSESTAAPPSLKTPDEVGGNPGIDRLALFLKQSADGSLKDQKDSYKEFSAIDSLLDSQVQYSAQRVIQPQQVAVAATMAGTAAQAKPDLNQKLDTVLRQTSQGPAQNKIDPNAPLAGAEQARNQAMDRKEAVDNKTQQTTAQVKEIMSQMPQAQANAGMQRNQAAGGSVASAAGVVASVALQGMGQPVAAAAIDASSAILVAQKGRGTFAGIPEPSSFKPVASTSKRDANKAEPYRMSYGDAPPQQVIAVPSGPTTASMNQQMSKGFGFGVFDRASLSAQIFPDLKGVNYEKVVAQSLTGQTLGKENNAADNILGALDNMRENSRLLTKEGKQALTEQQQQFVKAPPSPAGFAKA